MTISRERTAVLREPPSMIGGIPVLLADLQPQRPVELDRTQRMDGFRIRAGTDLLAVPVLDGKSFVIRMLGERPDDFFIGRDDNGYFASKLVGPAHVDLLLETGEEAFLASLMPELMRKHCELHGVEPVRQGDLWFAPCKHEWVHMHQMYVYRHQPHAALHNSRHHHIGGERLLLRFPNATPDKLHPRYFGRAATIIKGGSVTAPDHPAFAVDGSHLCVRADAFDYSYGSD